MVPITNYLQSLIVAGLLVPTFLQCSAVAQNRLDKISIMFIRLTFIVILAFATCAYSQVNNPTSLDLKLNARLDLKRFGGYDMDFVITQVDPMKLSTLTIDRTKMVTKTSSGAAAVGYSDYSGTYVAAAATSTSQQVPTTTPYEIPLTNGISVEGGSLQKLFLLYQDDRVSIYYQDTLATAIGSYRVRIVTKSRS